jgi:hypothetical protein
MPEDYITEKGKLDKKKQEAALKQRYQESDESFITEQQIWEDLQVIILKAPHLATELLYIMIELLFHRFKTLHYPLQSGIISRPMNLNLTMYLTKSSI